MREEQGVQHRVKYAGLKVGDGLDVCAAEVVPEIWVAVRNVQDPKRCPIGPGKTGESTVKVIRRIR